ncbi:MAG: DUF922 domain-containing protein [Pseudomonadota bacterium]
MRRISLVAAMVIMTGLPAAADEISEKMKVKHYTIDGRDALGLVKSMHRRGRKTDDGIALASLGVKTNYVLRYEEGHCKDGRLAADVKFTMRLPRLRRTSRLPERTTSAFNLFYAFLKRHEEEHRTITLGCIGRIQKQANRLLKRGRSCRPLEETRGALRAIVAKETRRCEGRHAALDRRDIPKVSKTPLYREAYATPVHRAGRIAERRTGLRTLQIEDPK